MITEPRVINIIKYVTSQFKTYRGIKSTCLFACRGGSTICVCVCVHKSHT